VVLRQEHRAGEKTFVDWAGDTVPIHDRESGETAAASIFVAVLGASTYTFARAALGQGLANWIDCHVRAFDFFQGVTKLLVPDNPRTGVTRACRYEPDLNRTYHEMAQHYGIAVLPARPRKPRDKAKVENAVGVVERWILAALRHRKFFAIAELNEAIEQILLERLNHRPFRKRESTRSSLFESIDRPALQPLPAQRYVMAEWKTVRANIDYHVEIDRHYYSVPINSPANSSKPVTPPPSSKYSTAASASPSMRATRQPTATRPYLSTCQRAIGLMSSGPLRS
jgi:transposase